MRSVQTVGKHEKVVSKKRKNEERTPGLTLPFRFGAPKDEARTPKDPRMIGEEISLQDFGSLSCLSGFHALVIGLSEDQEWRAVKRHTSTRSVQGRELRGRISARGRLEIRRKDETVYRDSRPRFRRPVTQRAWNGSHQTDPARDDRIDGKVRALSCHL